MRVPTPRLTAAAAVAAAAVTLGLAATAQTASARPADTGARSGDVVAVGSDTLQNAADFMFDGGANGAAGGYNSTGNRNRIFDIFATGDANGRATYDGTCGTLTAGSLGTLCSSANAGSPNLLPGTVVLRGGSNPVIRPNGSGAGVGALIADSGYGGTSYQGLPNGSIQFARMSRLPNSTEEGNCPTPSSTVPDNPCDGLHVYQFATDNLAIAHVSSGYNGPAAGLTPAQLVSIYTCQATTWNQVGGTSTDTIIPVLPQSGSGTRNFFLTDLGAANGQGANSQLKPGTCVVTAEEHDPDGILQEANKGDAIEPFSTGKLSLINSGYFSNGVNAAPSTPANAFTPGLLTQDVPGTGSASSSAYFSTRGLYFVIRQADLAITTPFQPGGAQNWANTLFAGGRTAVIEQSAAAIKAAGFTPAFKDCGVNPSSC